MHNTNSRGGDGQKEGLKRLTLLTKSVFQESYFMAIRVFITWP